MVEPLNTNAIEFKPDAEMFVCMDKTGCYHVSWNKEQHEEKMLLVNAEDEARYVRTSPSLPVVDGGEEETSSSRNDDLVASSALYQCDECIAEEREFSCHQIEDVVIVNGKVVCKDCVAEFYAKARTERAPDIAKKLRRQRMSVAQQQKRASAAESRVLSLEEEVKRLRGLIEEHGSAKLIRNALKVNGNG